MVHFKGILIFYKFSHYSTAIVSVDFIVKVKKQHFLNPDSTGECINELINSLKIKKNIYFLMLKKIMC